MKTLFKTVLMRMRKWVILTFLTYQTGEDHGNDITDGSKTDVLPPKYDVEKDPDCIYNLMTITHRYVDFCGV